MQRAACSFRGPADIVTNCQGAVNASLLMVDFSILPMLDNGFSTSAERSESQWDQTKLSSTPVPCQDAAQDLDELNFI
jgi:hypothetical protein